MLPHVDVGDDLVHVALSKHHGEVAGITWCNVLYTIGSAGGGATTKGTIVAEPATCLRCLARGAR